MGPVTLGILGISAVSGLAQFYQAEKARGAAAKELGRIKEMYDAIKPPDYDYSIEEPPELHDRVLRAPKYSGEMGPPPFNMRALTPELMQVVGEYRPELAPLIAETAPELLEKTGLMAEGQDVQKKALERYMQIAEDGFDPEYQQRVLEAKQRAQSEAQGRGEAIAQDFARRGIGGSGMELAAKIGASSDAMNRGAMMGLQAESEAYRNQLNALNMGAKIGGDLYDQDLGLQERNNQVINDFNQRMSAKRQNWENSRAAGLNEAQLRNLSERQRVADQNASLQNEYGRMNRSREDDLLARQADWRRAERGREDGLIREDYARRVDNRDYRDRREMMQAEWRRQNVKDRNALKDQVFANELAKADGKAGVSRERSALANQGVRDRNAAIQGITNAATTAWGAHRQREHEKELWNQRGSARFDD